MSSRTGHYSSLWLLWSWISGAYSRFSFPAVSSTSLFVSMLGRLECRSILRKLPIAKSPAPFGRNTERPMQATAKVRQISAISEIKEATPHR